MKKAEAKAFIKLGTSIRYLKDVKYKMADPNSGDESLGGNRVLSNIEAVLKLTSELGFAGTTETGAYNRLRKLFDELTKANETITCINSDQAGRLSKVAEDVRLALLAEGRDKSVYFLDDNEIARLKSDGWPEKLRSNSCIKRLLIYGNGSPA